MIVLLALSLLPASGAFAATFEIDNANSKVGFKIRRLSSDVEGQFTRFQGKVELNHTDIIPSQVVTTIDAASIDTKAEDQDEYLRKRFFNTKKFPQITFKSKRVENGKIVGDLTMHGVTKEVKFDFVFRGISDDSQGNQRAKFSATTILDRKDFGMLFSRFFDRGGVLLSNTIFMMIEFQATSSKGLS